LLCFPDEIITDTGNSNITVMSVDMSHQASIRQFAAEVHKTVSQIDVLIHNAGVALSMARSQSKDDIELTMATNHLGPYLLTHLLIDLLKRAAPSARIVVVASSLHSFAWPTFSLNPRYCYLPSYMYFASKLANIYFTRILAERLKGTGVTVNCLHPGMVNTGIFRHSEFPFSLIVNVVKKFYKTPQEGAATSIYLSSSPSVAGVTGEYFVDSERRELQPKYCDRAIHQKVWDDSRKLAGLTDDDVVL
jgi:NAD(P)-dependent dehydrogenase (short-subunit alcohol dehydrogenase family)